jgi:hypothetical protein
MSNSAPLGMGSGGVHAGRGPRDGGACGRAARTVPTRRLGFGLELGAGLGLGMHVLPTRRLGFGFGSGEGEGSTYSHHWATQQYKARTK